MSDPTTQTANDYGWGAPVVAVFCLASLLGFVIVAFLMKNNDLLTILAGVVATNATLASGYYLGSSKSSQSKDSVIAGQLPAPQVIITPTPTANT